MERTHAWSAEAILDLARSYQGAAVLAAGADLDLFAKLTGQPATAEQLAAAMECDLRALTVLLDALTALGLLHKQSLKYELPANLHRFLSPEGESTVLGMVQHQANCMRRWSHIARSVKTGAPVQTEPSVRGETGDIQSFIEAMDNVSAPMADLVIRAVQPLKFKHLLDVGGGSGTWTAAFLRACSDGDATLFDLPDVIPMAQARLSRSGLISRVQLVKGDFYSDPLPRGFDLVWLSAIAHQNSRQQNRALFTKLFSCLFAGGQLAIRDVVMEPGKCRPVAGALFAINMLVATPGGGTYTFDEYRADLMASGFADAVLARSDDGMNAVILAQKT